ADPDPRDDIYALACVAYELLTGKHPFNKLSAPKVLEKGLSPAPINKPGFNKRQNKALMRALALKREDRTPNIDEFWDGLKFKKSYKVQIAGGSIAAVLLIGSLSYTPIKETIEDNRNDKIIVQMQAASADVPSLLQGITAFDTRSYRNILEGAKTEVIGHYQGEALAQIDANQNKYDYPGAFRSIDQVEKFYPDSAQIGGIRSNVQDRLNTLISEETTKFDQFLEETRLMPLADEEDITDIIARLRQADPQNTLLTDARLTKAYADMAELAQNANNFQRANEILIVSLDFAPNDASLLNLDDQVKRELQRQADQQLVAQLKSDLQQARGNLNTLADYEAIKDQMIQLAELRPDDRLLVSMTGPLRNTISGALSNHVQASEFPQADALLFSFARLFTVSQLTTLRDNISRAEVEAGYQPTNLSAQLAQLDQRRQAIEGLLADAKYSTEWNSDLLQNFKETIALLRPGNTWFDTTRQAIATAYVTQAHQLVEADRFNSAQQLLDTGEDFYPGLAEFDAERQLLATAKQEFQREQAEQLRLAGLEALKNKVRVQVNAGELTNAVRSFESLKSELPPNDEFITAVGPQLIGDGFLRQADAQANRNNFSAALTLVRRGLEIAPNSQGLSDARDAYRGQASRQELQELASNITMNNINQLPVKLREVQQLNPQDRSAVQTEAIRLLATRIKNLESTDVVQANELLEAAKNIFTNNRTLGSVTLRQPPRPCDDCQRARTIIAEFKLTEAEQLLASAEQKQPGHEQIAAVMRELTQAKANATQYYQAFQQFLRAGQKNQAKPYLDQAIKLWNDNPDYTAAMRTNFTSTVVATRAAGEGRPCTASLAGYGRSGRAECYDMINGSRGPSLVVIPGGSRVSTQYAIGKYEISVAEFNAFCTASGQCQALSTDAKMPATNVSFSQAQAYAAWLSNETGKQYRIPSEAEWLHAASANNTDTNRDFNCRVTQGDQGLKGLAMLEIRAGRANPWGVTNYVGNAQEFISASSGLTARGGAFQDSLSNCTIDLAKSHSGSPDPLTGFRVARDLD
ncbi:MAG: SUMF1/EgtB/PvdO family nonheme iron enzyme, partial [Gammaproteobacteria bacterium]